MGYPHFRKLPYISIYHHMSTGNGDTCSQVIRTGNGDTLSKEVGKQYFRVTNDFYLMELTMMKGGT